MLMTMDRTPYGSQNSGAEVDGGRPSRLKEKGRDGTASFPYSSLLP